MTGALVLLAALIVVGVILRLTHRPAADTNDQPIPPPAPSGSHGEFCCGMHVVCEKDIPLSDKIVYYDDEELDEYAGREPLDYSEAETEQFRDILFSLLPADIAGWNRSLELRGIALPEGLRDEMLMIVADAKTSES